MTPAIQGFLEELEALNLEWQLLNGMIRHKARDCNCPLVAVAEEKGLGCEQYLLRSGRALGLTKDETFALVDAADAVSIGSVKFDPELRQALLKACHLEEPR